MGVESDYIIADRKEAKKINQAQGAHLKQWTCLPSKGIHQGVLTLLWGLLTEAEEFDEKFLKSIKLLDQESEQGAWVYLVPKRFVDKLLAVPDKDHKKLAEAWIKAAEFRKYKPWWNKENTWAYFLSFIAFFRQARAEKKDVLLWMSL